MENLLIKARAIELIQNHQKTAIRRRCCLVLIVGVVLGVCLLGALELLL